MKHLIYMAAGALALMAVSCKPTELVPATSDTPLTSITAKVSINGYDNLEFIGYPDENRRVVIDFPWYYPEASDNETQASAITDAKVTANLANNCIIKTPITKLDLTQENRITVVDQVKGESEYIVTGNIRKSSACEITSFTLNGLGISGVIKAAEITVVSPDMLPAKSTATVTLSPHATISPDPATTELDYNQDVKFTVTAHDGTQQQYVVKKGVPAKLEFGMRERSAKVMFAKKLKSDLGISVDNLTTGCAVSGNYLAINTRNEDILLIDRLTGEKKGTIALGSEFKGSLRNFYITSDDAGHIFMCNLVPNDGNVFKIWKINDVTSSPELYLSWDAAGLAFGRKFSIRGNTDTNAVITAPCHTNPTSGFYRWTITNGVKPERPEWGSATGIDWNSNVDLVYKTADPSSDYFVHCYSTNKLTWMDGATNTIKYQLGAISTNFIPNALDVVEFNGNYYLAANQVNSFSWGGADYVWLLDLADANNFTGTLDLSDVPAVKWYSFNEYGAKAIGETYNGNGTADVLLSVSDNGYYMYLYFLFTNGCVVGVQFDCIDM